MLYLTCTTISREDFACYGISRAKDWVSVDCVTKPLNRLKFVLALFGMLLEKTILVPVFFFFNNSNTSLNNISSPEKTPHVYE